MYDYPCEGESSKMDFTLGLITGAYAVFALLVFYIVYIIEVKLDLPGIVNSQVVPQSTLNLNNDQSNNNSNVHIPSELPELSQTRLRQMIESIIAETLHMPPLANGSVSEIALNKDTRSNGSENNLLLENGSMRLRHRHRTEHYFEPKIYQDLLATAVLNKIADKEGNIRQFSESTPDLSSCNIDTNFNVENRSTSSGSSVEPRSDFSYTDTEQLPKISKDAGRESALSDYIAAHTVPLPDLSAAVTESEEDDHASISSSILAEGTWEDNWLFKKKRSSLTASMTGSVGMLVPAPKDDVRAQIGDKTTDEISDLSEMGSDTDDSSLKIVRTNLDPLNDRILNKHLIGGQNTKVVLDELIETASLISNTTQSVDEPKYAKTRNKYVVEAASKIKAINPNVTKHSVQEGETILDNPETEREQNSLSDQLSSDSNRTDESTSTTIESFLADFNNEQDMPLTNISNNTSADTTELTNGSYLSLSPSYSKFNINQEQHFINNNNNHQQDFNREDDDVVHLRYFVPGSIAEREYKKWNNAVEMPNNPYAPEALKRRISGSQERFMDLPNISQSTNKNPISLIKTTKSEALAENESRSDIDYKRYSRDYYINDDKVLKTSPKHQIITTDSNCPSLNISDEPTADIAINESLSEKNETHAIENPIEPHPAVYQALPAQVVEENTSIETLSNQSMQSVNTTTSDDSDTVRIYNFKEQKTIVVRNGDKASTAATIKLTPETSSEPTLQVTVPLSPTLEDAPRCPISEQAAECETRQPTESTLEANINSSSITVNRTPITPTRGSTPMAFKFLQPKRKLIDPSQILSLDEGADALSIFTANEKAVVEEEVAQVMPSVKALAQAFILSSSKYTIAEKRWKKGVQNMPSVSSKPIFKQEAMQKTEASTSIAEIAEDATIASDLSSLETDPPTNKDLVTVKPIDDLSPITPSPTNSPTSDLATKVEGNKSATNALRRISMLKSNIAFFENLRFK